MASGSMQTISNNVPPDPPDIGLDITGNKNTNLDNISNNNNTNSVLVENLYKNNVIYTDYKVVITKTETNENPNQIINKLFVGELVTNLTKNSSLKELRKIGRKRIVVYFGSPSGANELVNHPTLV